MSRHIPDWRRHCARAPYRGSGSSYPRDMHNPCHKAGARTLNTAKRSKEIIAASILLGTWLLEKVSLGKIFNKHLHLIWVRAISNFLFHIYLINFYCNPHPHPHPHPPPHTHTLPHQKKRKEKENTTSPDNKIPQDTLYNVQIQTRKHRIRPHNFDICHLVAALCKCLAVKRCVLLVQSTVDLWVEPEH